MTQKITAVKNTKSQKAFILVGERDGRLRLISDAGEVMQLPAQLFDSERPELSDAEASAKFSPAAIAQFEKQLEKMAEEAEKAEKNLPYIVAKAGPAAGTRTRKTTTTKGAGKKAASTARTGTGRIVRAWNAPRLTFYRNKIHDLRPTDVIQIAIEGEGTFVCTREDFDRNFAEIMVSAEYKAAGLYTYPQIPEKARRFFRPE